MLNRIQLVSGRGNTRPPPDKPKGFKHALGYAVPQQLFRAVPVRTPTTTYFVRLNKFHKDLYEKSQAGIGQRQRTTSARQTAKRSQTHHTRRALQLGLQPHHR
jgi:hypothetical protein